MLHVPGKRILSFAVLLSLLAAGALPAAALTEEQPSALYPPYYIDEDNGWIMDINQNTSVDAFKSRYVDGTVQVYGDEGEVLEGNMATGQSVHMTVDGQTQIYTAVVHGDVDGDGAITISDVMEGCKILAKLSTDQPPQQDAYFCAAGVCGYLDNGGMAQEVTIGDIMELCKALASGRSIRYAGRIYLHSLSLDSSQLEMTVGETYTLTAHYDDPAAGPYLQWASSRPDILSVSANGQIQALAAGEATITVSGGGLSAACSVRVAPPPTPAAVEEGIYTLQNVSGVLQAADDQSVGLAAQPTADNQKFILEAAGDNRYVIRSALFPDCALEPVDEGGAPSSAIGADIALRPMQEGQAATWIFVLREDGSYLLSPSGNTRSAMTAEDGLVRLQSASGDHAGQAWSLAKQPDEAPENPEPAERMAWIDNLQTSHSVRVRTGPSTDYDIVGGFLKHQQITVTGEAVDGWYPVRGRNMGDGAEITGYTSGDYISFTPPDTNPAPVPTDIEEKLAALRIKFPDGKYWNHIGGENNPDGWTDTPCPADQNGGGSHTHSTYLPGECDCNNFNNAIQCMGFAFKIGNELFGTNVRNWRKFYDFDSVKIGDYIRYGGHSVIVIGKDDTGVRVVECNFDKQCGIRWDRFLPRQTLESQNAEYRTNN